MIALTYSTSEPSWCLFQRSKYIILFLQVDLQHWIKAMSLFKFYVCYLNRRNSSNNWLKVNFMWEAVYPRSFLTVMIVCHWPCRNTLEPWSPVSTDMAQGDGLEPMNVMGQLVTECGEVAGESWRSLLSHPAESLSEPITLHFFPTLCAALPVFGCVV